MGRLRSFGINFYLYFCERKSKKFTRVNFSLDACSGPMWILNGRLCWWPGRNSCFYLRGGVTIIVLQLYHHCIETSSWEYNRLKWLGGRPVISGPSTDTAFPLSAQPRSFVHQPAFWASGALLQVCNRLLVSQTQFWAFQDIFRCNHRWYSVAGIMQVRGLFSHCYLSSENIISSTQIS